MPGPPLRAEEFPIRYSQMSDDRRRNQGRRRVAMRPRFEVWAPVLIDGRSYVAFELAGLRGLHLVRHAANGSMRTEREQGWGCLDQYRPAGKLRHAEQNVNPRHFGALSGRGGNYMFAEYQLLDRWIPKYIGETGDFSGRMPCHDMAAEARKYGASHVLAHVTPGGIEARQAEEQDLIAAYNPPCNTQHKRLGIAALLAGGRTRF